MEEAVEGGGGHDGVAGEDLAPFGESLVGGDDGRVLLLVAHADHLEKQGGLLGIEPEVADLIDDEELGGGEHLHVVRHPVLGEGHFHPAHQIEGGEEKQPVSGLGAKLCPGRWPDGSSRPQEDLGR